MHKNSETAYGAFSFCENNAHGKSRQVRAAGPESKGYPYCRFAKNQSTLTLPLSSVSVSVCGPLVIGIVPRLTTT
jgi:hypothetical protein